jgi:4-amino-4-deoxy-L-arabinose transferase-like glycosyltransferase
MDNSLKPQARVVLGVALGLRLLVLGIILAKYPRDWLYTRGMEMGLLAKSLLAGNGLSSPFGASTGPTAFIAPGYPILVAGIFRIFGVYSFYSVIVILLLQVAINLGTIWLIMSIADELFDRRTALLTGWVWACSLPLWWLPTIFWDTSISICALLGVMSLALRIRRAPSRKLWILTGACCGAMGLVNPALILVLAAIVCWAGWQTARKDRAGMIAALIGALVIFSPWPIRNAHVFHAFVPLRTTVGFELWMGNHPGSTGYLDESLFPTFNPQELADYDRMGEIAYTSHKAQLAETYILQHPARFAELTLRRIFRFWTGTGTQNGSMLFVVHAVLSSLMGFAGLFLLFRLQRLSEGILFLIPILLFPVPYYITHAEFRYRLVVDPELVILGSYALIYLFARRQVASAYNSSEDAVAKLPA